MKKLLSLCLLLLTAIAGWAQEPEPTTFTVGNFKYTVTDEENHYVSIAKADEATFTSALVIPSSVTYEAVTYAVTSVGASGFYETGITSVTIPSSVLTIGDYAFQNCNSMTSITIADSEIPLSLAGTYGERPLWNNASTIYIGRNLTLTGENVNYPLLSEATSVEFGSQVTSINPFLFSENSKLENLTIGSGVTTIGEYAFNSCGTYWDDETHQGVENLMVEMGSNVTAIDAHAFQNCGKLKSVTLPSTLTTIGNEAFYCTGLTSISIPASVTSIGDFAFQYCDNMTSITIEDSETPLSLAGTYSERPLWNPAATIYLGRDLNLTGDDVNHPLLSDATSVEFGPKVTTINPYLFSGNSKLENLTIGSGVTTIGEYAFNSCGTYWDDETHQGVENLVVTMGSNVTSIGANAFKNCGKLKSVTLPSTLTTIGNEAFYFTGLTSISIPASVTSIGDFAFQYCNNMTSITIEDSETPLSFAGSYSERPFFNPATTIYLGRDLTLTGEDVNYPLLENATSVEFGPQVTVIPNYLFSGVTTLSSVKVPWLTPITLNASTFSENTYTDATLWVPGGTMDAYEAATNWKEFANKDFASFVVSITGSAHGTLAVADISSTNNETATTLIDRGEDAVFTVIPATGYEINTFTVNDVAATPTEGSYTVEDLSADQTVVATFSPINYDLTLTLNGGTASNPANYTIETTTFTLNNPTKTGYDFAGWKLNGEGDAMMTVTITQGSTGHLAYTATWQVNQYTITFNSNGGTDVDPITLDYGSTVTPPAAPTKSGYDFAGWTPELPETMPAENITVTATWTVKTYTVSITGGGVTADNYSPEDGDNVVLTIMDDPDATLTSLTVNGTEVKESIVDNQYIISGVTGNVSVVATWSSTKEFITLSTPIATFSCSEDLNFTGSDLKAYIAAGYNKSENSVLLVRVYDVPANTGLVIRGEEGQTYKIPYSTSQSYFVNLLKAHLTSDEVPATSGDYNNYVLKRDADVYNWQHPTSGTMKLGEKKAYLQIPTSFMPAGVREIRHIFVDSSTTDLSKFVILNNGKASGRVYNLNGQQVDNMRKGVYIVNGRKVMK